MTKRSIAAIIGSTVLWALPVAEASCPANLTLQDLGAPPASGELSLFAMDKSVEKWRTWRKLPLQLDPMTEEGLMRELKDQKEPSAPHDRLAFEMNDFGPALEATDDFPCGAQEMIELQNPYRKDDHAYLAWCERPSPPTLALPVPVVAEPEKFRVTSPLYEYNYWPQNQLLYKNMIVFGNDAKRRIAAGSDSEMLLHLDVKNFFTMNMTSEDISTITMQRRTGPVGSLAMIDFFLEFLLFKINLKLTTVASFYAKSAHIPMIVDVPVNAHRLLNEGSGMLYHWNMDQASVDLSHPSTRFPVADPKLILKGPQALVETGRRYCEGDEEFCVFRFHGEVKGAHSFVMDINIPRILVDQGFFPLWVKDLTEFKRGMDWETEPDPVKPGTVGVFMANAGLAKGRYKMSYWIKITDGETTPCPHPVNLVRRVTAPQRPPVISH